MATLFTHALVGAAIAQAAPLGAARGRIVACAALLAMLPDLDVLGSRIGIAYEHALGHRGLSHSIAFAVMAGLLVARFGFQTAPLRSREGRILTLTFALAMASHGVLDAFTDAGLGVGFWLPFDASRSFFPWRPLETSPLGIRAFFSGPALAILANEARWVGLPVCVFLAGLAGWRAWYSRLAR